MYRVYRVRLQTLLEDTGAWSVCLVQGASLPQAAVPCLPAASSPALCMQAALTVRLRSAFDAAVPASATFRAPAHSLLHHRPPVEDVAANTAHISLTPTVGFSADDASSMCAPTLTAVDVSAGCALRLLPPDDFLRCFCVDGPKLHV